MSMGIIGMLGHIWPFSEFIEMMGDKDDDDSSSSH